MNEHELEQLLEKLLKQDFSEGTEAFRDALLERCLEGLDSDERVIELSDYELDLVAAAGDPALTSALELEDKARNRT